jgi:hypothetical protein
MLRKHKDAGLSTLGGKPVPMPSRKLNTGNILRRNAPHVEHNRTETASL